MTTMYVRMKRMLAGLALAGLLSVRLFAGDAAPGPAPAAGGGGDEEALDVVYRIGHIAQPPIKVVFENWLVVKGEKGNFHPEYLSVTIEEIDYHDRTPRWNLAMERVQQRNWAKALINFKKMYDDKDPAFAAENVVQKCAWSEEVGSYYYGLALLKNGQAKLAAEKFMASFKAKADGRYSLPSLLGAADAYLQENMVDEAMKSLKQFDDQLQVFNKAVDEYKWPATMVSAKLDCRVYGEELKLTAAYILAKVSYQQAMEAARDGKKIPADAEAACEEYVRKATDAIAKLDGRLNQPETQKNPALSNQLLGQWQELDAQATQVSNMLVDIRIGNKDFDGARSKCQQTITDYEKSRDPRMVSRLPAAYAGLGKVAFFEADNLKSKNDPIKAQKMFAKSRWYYQHVMVIYFDNTRYLQDALYYTGMCNEYLAKLNVEKDAREKAYDNFKRLAEMLPETDPRYKDVVAGLERTKPSGGGDAPKAN